MHRRSAMHWQRAALRRNATMSDTDVLWDFPKSLEEYPPPYGWEGCFVNDTINSAAPFMGLFNDVPGAATHGDVIVHTGPGNDIYTYDSLVSECLQAAEFQHHVLALFKIQACPVQDTSLPGSRQACGTEALPVRPAAMLAMTRSVHLPRVNQAYGPGHHACDPALTGAASKHNLGAKGLVSQLKLAAYNADVGIV
eukprot:364615-Chlamydomonas_euryale.AAC.38